MERWVVEGKKGVVESWLCVECMVSRGEEVKLGGNVGGGCGKGK